METTERGYVLFLAAEARELSELAARKGGQPMDWPVDYARMSDGAIFASNGPGPDLAARAVREIAGRVALRAVVNIGFCGALDPSLAVGDIVLANAIVGEDGARFPATLPGAEPHERAKVGPVLSVNRVAVTCEEKMRLRLTGACAVEMEAAGAGREAMALGIPFYCVRVVSDTAAEDMALDFNQYRNAEGRFSRVRIAAAAVMQPSRISGLRKFDANCRLASASLGGFLADCRF